MRATLWSAALWVASTLAAPGNRQEKRQLSVSQEGSCGSSSGNTCLGSFFGECCSEAGFCGNANSYCGQGCQSGYGNCTGMINGLAISNDGTCGNGVTCESSIFGDCCSGNGFCGSTSDYCSTDCNSAFGFCGSTTSAPSRATVFSNSTTSTSALAASTTNPTCPKSNGTVYVASSLNQYEVECGFDRPGNDLKQVQVYSNTISGCISECENTTGCVDIIMSGTACYLKKAIGKTSKSSNHRGARLFKRGPVTNTTSSVTSSTSQSTSSYGFFSSSSAASAGSTTSSAPITITTNPTCPKSNGTEFVATSGAIYLIECWLDRQGNDIKSVQVYSNKIADCINQCDSTPGCADISMAGTACYLKSKAGTIKQNTGVRGARLISPASSSSSSSSTASSASSSVLISATPPVSINSTLSSSGTGTSFAVSTSSAASNTPSASVNSTTASSSSFSASASGSLSISVNSTSSVTISVSSHSISSSTGISSSVPVGTGSSGLPSSSNTESSPYGNGTSTAVVTGPTGTGVTPILTSTLVSSSAVNLTSTVSTTTSVLLSTGVSSSTPIGTGPSSYTPSSSTESSPYGNGTSTGVVIGPTGTGVTSIPPSTGVSSSVIINSTSAITSINSTSTKPISVPLTTAPLTTGPSSGSIPTSSSTGVFTNSTASQNTTSSTTSYAFAAGGVPSGHPVVTNTTACSTKPTSTAACTPCDGQGSGDFCGYTATDNSYEVMPITCNTVTVDLELTECTVSPDGFERKALCINGQTPGPLIEAQWGDTIVAHVTNSMTINGSSIHWHGMRQNYTNEMDGVVSVTQCPLAPGESMTYTFKATNYGFSWYHSHLTLQAYEGLFGPMWVHGPQTQTADNNAGSLIVQDWSHISVDDMYIDAEIAGVRTMDTGLINGMNVWGDDGSSNQTGERYTVPTEFVSGQSYMFNILNAAIQSTYKFYIDGHTMTVISADYVPIVPYQTDVLNINIGQRYQVIVTANQTVGDYWLRFDNQNACASTIKSDNIKGLIHYSGSAGGLPTSTGYNYTRKYDSTGAILGTCEDEALTNLVPAAAIDVGSSSFEIDHTVVVSNSNPTNLYRWYLDGTTFQTNWADATLYDIYNNNTVPDYSGNLAIEVPNLGEWVYVIIESAVPLGHPIHLHGHDFHILARGYGTYDSSVELNLSNPPRRDVAFMPGDGPTGQGGYLVVAFLTDNPGAWLMHCHIGWHVAMGFAIQFIEAKDQIKDTVTDSCMLNDVCATWRNWADDHDIHTDDSGV